MNQEDFLGTISDVKQTFDSPHGKKTLLYLMLRAGCLRTSYVPGDPYGTAFNEGQRAFVLSLFEDLQVNIKDLEQKFKEVRKQEAEHVTL